MQRSRSSLRRGPRVPMSDAEVGRPRPRVLCQTRRSPDAVLAFQCQTRRSPDADLASFVRRGGRQMQTSHSNVRRGPRVLCQMRTPANSVFQLKRKSEQLRVPVSSTSQHQSEVRVQCKTRISAITDIHKPRQLHPIFSPHNGE